MNPSPRWQRYIALAGSVIILIFIWWELLPQHLNPVLKVLSAFLPLGIIGLLVYRWAGRQK